MPTFDDPKKLANALQEIKQAYSSTRNALMLKMARDACYHEGLQWLRSYGQIGSARLGKSLEQWNPDLPNLRIVANQVTANIVKIASQTGPTSINLDVKPPPAEMSMSARHKADTLESAALAMLEDAGFLETRKTTNFERSVVGDYGIVLFVERGARDLDLRGRSVRMPDARLRAFPFDPGSQLYLDPEITDRELHNHDFVWWQAAWSARKIARVFGVKLDPKKLRPIGQLTPVQQEVAKISNGRLFRDLASHSKTPGALVWQGHYRNGKRFDEMYLLIEAPQEAFEEKDNDGTGMLWLNRDQPESPFGGNGLPYALYHGLRRHKSMWSISDVALQVGGQDRLNLMETMIHRWIQRSAGFKVFVDRATLKDRGAEESFRKQWNNEVGGAVFFDSKNNRRALPPQIAQMPLPPPLLKELSLGYREDMDRQVNITDPVRGQTKSHVPDSSFAAAVENAGQVKDDRVKEDVRTDAQFITMALGTMLRLARDRSPSVLGKMREIGFDQQDLAALLSVDPFSLGCQIIVRESSVRTRSPEGRRRDLTAAVEAQAVTALDYRMIFASDLDAPLAEVDRDMAREARKATERIILGETWEPVPLGDHNEFFVRAFRQGFFDRRARVIDGARQRLQDAIVSQQQMATQEAIAANPELAVQAQQPEQPATPEVASVGDVLARLVPGNSPEAAAAG